MRRRSICSCANTDNKRLKQQDQQAKYELPHLPDIIVHKLFQLIPTKTAVCSSIVSKQWQGVFSLGVPFLDLDEGDENLGDHVRSRKLMFIDFVESCLRRCKTNRYGLNSFRLRMRYDCDLIDSSRIDKWLSFAVERGVKELEISIQRKHDQYTYYCIPETILNAKFLTSLTLEHVRMEEIANPINLPLLKTLSLKAVIFDGSAAKDASIWMGCPSIEHLSLASCYCSSLSGCMEVRSSSVKSLQVMDCRCWVFFIASENLESMTFTSEYSEFGAILLNRECVKLKYINIRAQHLHTIVFHGTCRDNLQATIDVPNLEVFKYYGYLLPNDVMIVKAQNRLREVYLTLDLDYKEDGIQSTFFTSWPDFSAWRDFLCGFYYCSELELDIRHDAIAEALTFPESLRRVIAPPLFRVKIISVKIVRLRCPQTVARVSDLMNSLGWMAPNANFGVTYWDYDDYHYLKHKRL